MSKFKIKRKGFSQNNPSLLSRCMSSSVALALLLVSIRKMDNRKVNSLSRTGGCFSNDERGIFMWCLCKEDNALLFLKDIETKDFGLYEMTDDEDFICHDLPFWVFSELGNRARIAFVKKVVAMALLEREMSVIEMLFISRKRLSDKLINSNTSNYDIIEGINEIIEYVTDDTKKMMEALKELLSRHINSMIIIKDTHFAMDCALTIIDPEATNHEQFAPLAEEILKKMDLTFNLNYSGDVRSVHSILR